MEDQIPTANPATEPIAYRDPQTPEAAAPLSGPQVATLALRLMAVYVWIMTLQWFALLLTTPRWSSFAAARNPQLYVIVIYAGAGVGIWLLAEKISHWMIGDAVNPTAARLEGSQLQAIAFSVVGVILVCWSIPSLVNAIAAEVARNNASGLTLTTGARFTDTSWVRYALQLAIGLILFFQAKGLARLWHRLRSS